MADDAATGALWGSETARAVANFRISGESMPPGVVEWVARIKAAAALVNAELGLLDGVLAQRIAAAAHAIAAGEHADQFPVDVFQTGSGTSTNMNVNEVISALTGGAAHPNDHVNLGQSSNDVMPTALHLAACEGIASDLLPAVRRLVAVLRTKAVDFADVVKPGRTHLMDAVPVLLGDEFEGFAVQVEECAEHLVYVLDHLARVPLGGTAVGTGLNAHPDLADRVLARLADPDRLGATPRRAPGPIARQGARDAVVAASGALNTTAVALTKIANDLRWMASGPNAGLGEIRLPALQKGSSIMPGKVNPVIPEVALQVAAQVMGNHVAITVAGAQGNFELNVTVPLIARNLLGSTGLLAAACRSLADDCVAGIEADIERCERLAARSPAIATALNPLAGYERVEQIVKAAAAGDLTIRDAAIDAGLDPERVDELLDLRRMARRNRPAD